MINSDFDGLGHYRSQKTEGNFPAANVRSHFANFNPAQGTYTVDPVAQHGFGLHPVPAGLALGARGAVVDVGHRGGSHLAGRPLLRARHARR